MKYVIAFLVSLLVTVIGTVIDVHVNADLKFLTGWFAATGYFATLGFYDLKEKSNG